MYKQEVTKFCCEGEKLGEMVMPDVLDCSDDELMTIYSILHDSCYKCLAMPNVPALIHLLRDILEYYAVEVANRSLQQTLSNPSAVSDERAKITTSPCSSLDGE